jgi:hypothetical protein
MRFYLVLICSVMFFQASCSKKSDDGGGSGTSAGNIRGQVIVDPATCGSTIATVSIGGSFNNTQAFTRQVNSGGSFDFNIASGTYTLSAQAGSCYVSASNVGVLSPGQTPYRICLTTNAYFCQQNGYYKMSSATAAPVQNKSASASTMKNCNWLTYGCSGSSYPGKGTALTVNRSLYFYPAQDVANVSLVQKFKDSSSVNLFVSPSLGNNGWNLNIGANSTISADNAQYGYLNVDSQFDHSILQNSSGKCLPRNEMLTWISQYLKDQGYHEKSIASFTERNKAEIPPNDNVCIYPQTFTQTDQVVEYESSEDLELKRVWFLVIPELHKEVMRLRVDSESMKAWFSKPKTDPVASFKTNGPLKPMMLNASKPNATRTVANKYYLPTEEIALVFLLEN